MQHVGIATLAADAEVLENCSNHKLLRVVLCWARALLGRMVSTANHYEEEDETCHTGR